MIFILPVMYLYKKIFRPIWLVGFICFSNCFFLSGQVIPADDRDLDKIFTELQKTTSKIEGWEAMDCAKLDCAEMQFFNNRLRDALLYLRYSHYWLKRAAESQLQHLLSVGNQTNLATERAERVQRILYWQTYVHRIGSALLDIASLGAAFEEIARDPKKFEPKTYAEMADMIDKFYETMKDAENLKNTLDAGKTGKDFPKPIAELMPSFAGISSDQWNDVKSTLSNLKSVMAAADRYKNDWKKVLKEGRGLASVGQIIGRVVTSISKSEIEERQKLVDELLFNIVKQDQVQSASYKDLQRLQARRNKAEDALKRLQSLIVISGYEGDFTRWLLKFNNRCSFNTGYTSNIQIPDSFIVSDFNFVADADKSKSWGNALEYFNVKLQMVPALLGNLPTVSAISPGLTLPKNMYDANEDIRAMFKAPVCYPADSWVGVLKTNIPHDNEEQNSSSVIGGKSYLNRREEGTMLFKAPQEEGSYELRMYDIESGKEVSSVSFMVRKPANTNVVTNPVAPNNLSSWTENAMKHRGKTGQRFTYRFGPGNSSATVWGTTIYTDDTSIALAAVHAGLITFQQGGVVTIEIRPGMQSYTGSKANGINSGNYGAWNGSYVFVK